MSALAVFDFEDQPVRTMTLNGEPWFVGSDVCRCLALANPRDAMLRLNDDERKDGVGITDTIGREQKPVLISEPGVYRLIFESRKPEAERFRRWVFHEVLPAIRKTGSYAAEAVDWDAVGDKLHLVKQARLTFGRKAAQDLWQQLGLPDIAEDRPGAAAAGDDQLMPYLADFLEECTEAETGGMASANDLYRVFLKWATVNKAPHLTAAMFGILMRKRGIRKRKSHFITYLGLRIKHEVRVELFGHGA